jgi:hypothetical protein
LGRDTNNKDLTVNIIHNLNRRDFLKFTGIVLASGVVLSNHQAIEQVFRLVVDAQIRFGKQLLRGTSEGTILSSSDDGATWNKLVGFGEAHPILQFEQRDEQVYANLGVGSHNFWLRSHDGRKWFTV